MNLISPDKQTRDRRHLFLYLSSHSLIFFIIMEIERKGEKTKGKEEEEDREKERILGKRRRILSSFVHSFYVE